MLRAGLDPYASIYAYCIARMTSAHCLTLHWWRWGSHAVLERTLTYIKKYIVKQYVMLHW
jgi:hypothetical protein